MICCLCTMDFILVMIINIVKIYSTITLMPLKLYKEKWYSFIICMHLRIVIWRMLWISHVVCHIIIGITCSMHVYQSITSKQPMLSVKVVVFNQVKFYGGMLMLFCSNEVIVLGYCWFIGCICWCHIRFICRILIEILWDMSWTSMINKTWQ